LLGASGAEALAASPAAPTISEPPVEGTLVHASDVHMEAYGYSDPDGNPHSCSEWQIVTPGGELVWESRAGDPTPGTDCLTDVLRNHVHFGNGFFVNSHGGRIELFFDTPYRLRVRFRDSTGTYSAWAERNFRTRPLPPAGTASSIPWVPRERGYAVEPVASGFQLPTHIAFLPQPGTSPQSALLYVGELYGAIKSVTRNGTVQTYRSGLLNFNPLGDFPGSGEFGVGGMAVDPANGDVYASMVYQASPPSQFRGRVVRMSSGNGGFTGGAPVTVLDLGTDLPGEQQAPSHQISNLSFGPDGTLFLHQADGFQPGLAQNIDSYLGKILRFDRNGDAVSGSPHYTTGDGITTRDYVWARGFRNPFGGAWRAATNDHYIAENGPMVDRFTMADFPQPDGGLSWGWNGSDASMTTRAIYNWNPSHAPVHVAFVQNATFSRSGYPADKNDHAFVTESGPTYATGPQPAGKRIVEFAPGPSGELTIAPKTFVEYEGIGKATAVGLAAGPDGLYFSDLYKDVGASSPIDPGARLLRVRYYAPRSYCAINGRTLEISLAPPSKRKGGKSSAAARKKKKKKKKKKGPRKPSNATVRVRDGAIYVNGHFCGATVNNVDTIDVKGAKRTQQLTVDLRGGSYEPGATLEAPSSADLELVVDLKRGRDTLMVFRKKRQRVTLSRRGASLNGDDDRDLFAKSVERVKLKGPGGKKKKKKGR
jgi:glucose/arabinose dehydrogenase